MLRPAGCCALLHCLLAALDGLVQAVDSWYENYHRVFGRRQRGTKERLEMAADQRNADNYDQENACFLTFSKPLQTSYTDEDSSNSLFGCYSSMLSLTAALQT